MPTHVVVKREICKHTWTTLDGNHCTLHVIQDEILPPPNQLPCLCRNIWELYGFRCWLATGKEWHLATCMWWSGDQQKPHVGPIYYLGNPLTTSNRVPWEEHGTYPLNHMGYIMGYRWVVCMSHDRGESSWDKPKWDASNMRICFISQLFLSIKGTISNF